MFSDFSNNLLVNLSPRALFGIKGSCGVSYFQVIFSLKRFIISSRLRSSIRSISPIKEIDIASYREVVSFVNIAGQEAF